MIKTLSQRDPQWANIKLGTSNTTIGSHGCTITSLTMLLNHYGGNYTPDQVNERLKSLPKDQNGNTGFANGNLVYWSRIKEAFPQVKSVERITNYDNNKVASSLPALVEVDGSRIGASKHWVLYIGNQKMLDPWFGNEKSTSYYAPTGCTIFKVDKIEADEPMITIPVRERDNYITRSVVLDGFENAGYKTIQDVILTVETNEDRIKTLKEEHRKFLIEMSNILDPETVLPELPDNDWLKNLAKIIINQYSEVQSELKKKETQWRDAAAKLNAENTELEKQVVSLRKELAELRDQHLAEIANLNEQHEQELDRLEKRIEQVSNSVEKNKEKREENEKIGNFIIDLFNKFFNKK